MNKTTIILRSLLMMLVLAVSTSVLAQQISESEAEEIAMSFLTRQQQSKPKKAAADDNALDLIYTEPSAEDSKTANLYVFRRKTGGFAIIAGDARANSLVLGYSDKNDFSAEQMPENVKYWLGEYARQIDFLKNREPEVSAKARSKKMAVLKSASIDTDGEWLVQTEWSQWNAYGHENAQHKPYPLYFNNFTPTEDDKHCVTGCVATAMAQVLYYHAMTDETKYQPDFIGESSYTWKNQTLTAPYENDRSYDWEAMALKFSLEDNSKGTYSTQPQNTEIAHLIRDCGVSVEMDYGKDGSSAFLKDAVNALQEHFGYTAFMKYIKRNNYSTQADWDNLMIAEINAKRPVLFGAQNDLSNGGHAFILDGYKYESDNVKYHINWGWRGQNDGFYISSALNPDIDTHYNSNQDAIINIYPDVDDGWSDWERIGKFGYTYTAVNYFIDRTTKEGNVTVYSRTTADGLRTEMKITDWGNGIFSNSDEIGDMFISIDRTKKIDGSNNKYLATIQPFNTKQKYTSDNVQYEMYLKDKVSGNISDDDDTKYSYYDDDTDILYLNLFMSFGGFYFPTSHQDQLNLAWTAWEPFAPAGSNEGTFTYNTKGGSGPTKHFVYVKTKLDTPNEKQIQVKNWVKGGLDSEYTMDLVFNWDSNDNSCDLPTISLPYSFSIGGQSCGTMYYQYSDTQNPKRKCYYDPDTRTFYFYAALCNKDADKFYKQPAIDILQMDNHMTLSDDEGFYATQDMQNVNVKYERNVSSDWGTLVVPFDFDPTKISGFDFYQLESGSSTVLNFQKIGSNNITAHTPLIYKRTQSDVTKMTVEKEEATIKAVQNTPSTVGAWQTIGTYSPIAIVNGGTINGKHTNAGIDYTIYDNTSAPYYVFSGGDVKHTSGTIRLKPFRALFKDTTGNAAKQIKVSFLDVEEPNSIGSLSEDEQSVPERNKQKARINLAGQHVGKGYRGFVIENGKKMLYR